MERILNNDMLLENTRSFRRLPPSMLILSVYFYLLDIQVSTGGMCSIRNLEFGHFGDIRSPNWIHWLYQKNLLYRPLGALYFFFFHILPNSHLFHLQVLVKHILTNDVKRKPPQRYSNVAVVKTFVATHTIPSLHLASPAGITSLVVSRTNSSQFLMSGNDKIVQLYDRRRTRFLRL
jgi:hypothetical protein